MTGPIPVAHAARTPNVAAGTQQKSREIRVGLVMYGGVSLAVYINGVSREFFDAVRGRGVYRLLKALTDSDVVVDVISGTSAGGINGILLGYALCNGREFAACADLWRQHGDIARLLREPSGAARPTISLLNSETYYQPKLAGAFADMTPCVERADEDVSPTQELDLFVTGTEVAGRRYTVLDDAGHAVDVKDHRTVFIVKHRAGRREPFDPAFNVPQGPEALRNAVTHGALAKLGRITSCFPVAFAPVKVAHVRREDVKPDSPPEDRIDALLTEWGALRRESCFLDGGVLDNKPFTYTVREIFRRTAERDVERRLFYVEPDPEQFRDVQTVQQPHVVQAALLALVGIPGYESIADDLKLLAERNTKIRTYKRLAEQLEQTGRGPRPAAHSIEEMAVYSRARLVALSQRVVRGLLRTNGDDQLLDAESRRLAEPLFEEFDRYAERADIAETLLRDFDVYFRLRRLYDLVDHCYYRGRLDPAWPEVLRVLNRQIKLVDIVRNAMEQLLDEVDIPWRGRSAEAVWADVGRAFWRLLAVHGDDSPVPEGYGSTLDDARVRDLLSEVNLRLRQRIDAIKAEMRAGRLDAPPDGATNLLHDADAYERTTIAGFVLQAAVWDDVPLTRYERFDRIDARLYPLEMFGDVNEKDEIRTVRVSPVDAQRGFSRREGTAKTAGQTLFHFGGFFKRSWRSNDILCGRLDAVAQILEEFFDRDRLARVAADTALAPALMARLASDLDPAQLFPNAGRAAQDRLRDWLRGLLARAPEAYEPNRFDEHLTLLVEAAQLEILHEDLPGLVADELLEAREWEKPDEGALTPVAAAAQAHSQAAARLVACGGDDLGPAERIAATAAPTAKPPEGPRDTAFGRFFAGQGGATGGRSVLASVPPIVLLETLARVLLVTRDAVVTAFGERAGAVRGSALYRWLDRGLRLFHGGVLFCRRASPQAMAAAAALAAVALVAFVIGVVWWDEIVAPAGKPFQFRWFVLFLVVPAAVLLGQMALLLGVSRLRRLLSLGAVLALAAAVTVIAWQREAVAGQLAGALESLAAWLRKP